MKKNKSAEMWKNALEKIDEKYIDEAAQFAPASENNQLRAAPSKEKTGNLGFVFAAAAAVVVTLAGVGFVFDRMNIEPLSPAAETSGIYTDADGNIIDSPVTIKDEKTPLTLEYVQELSASKGEEITWNDFEAFEGTEVGSGLYIMHYAIDDEYSVMIGGTYGEKPWYVRLVRNLGEDNEEYIDIRQDNVSEFIADSAAAASPFELLGDYYLGDDGLYHVSGESWTVCSDYDLFREYFFGVWGEDFAIDDSEKAWIALNNQTVHFREFYKASENVLAFTYGGSAGTTLCWLDTENPNVLYEAYGNIGDFPNGFPKNTDGTPMVFTKTKTSSETNEPENGYLSVYRIRELAKKHGIEPSLITDFEFEALGERCYHDSKYYFYPMYLVADTEDYFALQTEAKSTEAVYFSGTSAFVTVSFEKRGDGGWERSINYESYQSENQLRLIYDENNPTRLKSYEYYGEEPFVSVTIPEGITEIGEYAFEGGEEIQSVILPSSLVTIGEGAFKDCVNLQKVSVASLPADLRAIGAGAFSGCTALNEFTMPYGVATIGSLAFENCISLPADYYLPDSTMTIGDDAFKGCTQLDGTMKPVFGADFICPVDDGTITADYCNFTDIGAEQHSGIDYYGEIGDNVYAAADGTVANVVTEYENGVGDGINITIDHGNRISTYYAHLDSVAVKKGDTVSQGDIIGYVGSTGWSTGPHLHFGVFKSGVITNPHNYLNDPIQLKSPVSDENSEENILYGYGGYEGLTGIVYGGSRGQAVYSAAVGVVTFAEYDVENGLCIKISHRDGYETMYAHLDELKVKAGDSVSAGQTIGTMGYTGMTTPEVQLLFELSRNGVTLDPSNYMRK